MIRFPVGVYTNKMKEEIYYCKDCKKEEWQLPDSTVWCYCHPRAKRKMVKVNKELQKVMKEERKINLEVSRW